MKIFDFISSRNEISSTQASSHVEIYIMKFFREKIWNTKKELVIKELDFNSTSSLEFDDFPEVIMCISWGKRNTSKFIPVIIFFLFMFLKKDVDFF